MSQVAAAAEQLPVDDEWRAELSRRIDRLCEVFDTYLETNQVAAIRKACNFASEAHAGIQRKSGEPYVFHPIAVAKILAEVRFDHETILGAILHDVIEDTKYTKDDLAERFGNEVAELVDGVSKLTQIKFGSRQEAQAENFRKMFMAMAKDIRVIMIKLADRLHNMRTLGSLSSQTQRRIARETLEIYAPIANRLGMNHLRSELEDLGFRYLYPLRYSVLAEALKKRSGNRKEIIVKLETRIRDRLLEEDIKARVSGREKHLWDIYQKMRSKNLPFREIHDVYAVRIIVGNVDTCYRALGLVHGLYKPVMGRFKDYIAIPKMNGYQSLHTVLFGRHELPIEIQIRTHEMHVMAEAGIAAHWLYKAPNGNNNTPYQRAREWLQKLLEIQRRAGNSLEFLENVKLDLFPSDIYVFTPRGEIIELPRGATVVDFAYAIHSDVGNTCVGAKVDFRFVPLRTPLSTGETVEVILSPTARPDPAWLGFVVTGKARASVRHYLNHLKREEAIILGRRLLEKALPGNSNRISEFEAERIDVLVKELKAHDFDDILADVGLGKRLAAIIARRLFADKDHDANHSDSQPLLIRGTEGEVVTFAKCCRPIPGDPIVGYLSSGRGITIHRDICKNVVEYKKAPDKWLEVEWANTMETEFAAGVRLDVSNKRGALATVALAIAEAEANIDGINTTERDGVTTTLDLILKVHDRDHLAQVVRRLRTIPDVLRLARRS